MIRRWKEQLGENGDRAFPAKAIRAGGEMTKLRRELNRAPRAEAR